MAVRKYGEKTWRDVHLEWKKEQTNIGFCLCEFIDNSINSWQKNNSNIRGLTVKIKYDEDKEKEDYKFTIEDNAYGMNDEELAEAIMPKNQNTNAGELGAHGVGMKLALFWTGKSIEIKSKREEEEKMSFWYMNEKKYDESANIETECVPSSLELERGTVIIVEDINHYPSIKEYLGKVESILSLRYCKFIKEGLKIQINNHELDYKDISWWNFSTFYTSIKAKGKEEKYEIISNEDKIISAINKIEIDKYNATLEKYGCTKLKELIIKSIRDKSIESYVKFSFSPETEYQKIDINGNETEEKMKIKVYWGFLNNSCGISDEEHQFRSLHGGYFSEAGRYICHSPNESHNAGSQKLTSFGCYPLVNDDNDFSTRLIMEIDLTGVVLTQKNKKDFSWQTDNGKKISADIQNFLNDMKPIIKDVFRDIFLKNIEKKIEAKDIPIKKKQENLLKEMKLAKKFKVEDKNINGENEKWFKLEIKEKPYEFCLKLVPELEYNNPLLIAHGPNEGIFPGDINRHYIYINSSHKVWKDMIDAKKNKGTFSNAIGVFAICFSLIKIRFEEKDNEIFERIDLNEFDFIKLVDEILNYLTEDE